MDSSSSSVSSKRAKAPSDVTHIVSCLVDGCNSDLSQCREYHRRHKVCELHSKTPKVTIGGREVRFCQQCSRFHSLAEFDEGKRSCRKRLDCHNRRRRKPQSESISRNVGNFLSDHQGTTLLSFSNPQIFPSTMLSSTWTGDVKTEGDAGHSSSYPCLTQINGIGNVSGCLTNCYGENQFRILKENDLLSPEASASHAPLDPNNSRGSRMFSNGMSRVVDSDCALSLLSSARAETPEMGWGHVEQPGPESRVHSLHYGSGFSHDSYSQGTESKPSVSIHNSDIHFGGMFQSGPDGPSLDESPQTLSFRWE
ncbi:hypothetical protein NMG60_11030931 [Bertholletia excelsa]